jgi:ferredoxin
MKVTVDPDKCCAHEMCVQACPEVFELRAGDDVVSTREPNPDEALRSQVMDAANQCPAGAITIEG